MRPDLRSPVWGRATELAEAARSEVLRRVRKGEELYPTLGVVASAHYATWLQNESPEVVGLAADILCDTRTLIARLNGATS